MPTPLKEKLREFLTKNQLEKASRELIRHIPASSHFSSKAVILSASLNEILEKEIKQIAKPEDTQLWKRQWVHNFDQFLSQLPQGHSYIPLKDENELNQEAKIKPKGIKVNNFKWRVFLGILVSKGIVLAYLYYLHDRSTFLESNFVTLVGVLVPIFTASLALVLKDYFDRQRNPEPYTEERVSPRTQWISYVLIFLYALFIIIASSSYRSNGGDFTNFMGTINSIEASLGVGIGFILSTYFKADAS